MSLERGGCDAAFETTANAIYRLRMALAAFQ